MYTLIKKSISIRQMSIKRCYWKCFSTSTTHLARTHYEALGIPKNSTQNDIKAAYYKLSMQYHPDKNKGSDSAATKFREITQAYEVLGNYRLRRLYDKGILHTAGSQFAQSADIVEPEVEDDPETKFYKSRFRKSSVGDQSGRTPIYDFDEWSRAHYGKTFERRRDAKLKWDNVQERKRNNSLSAQNEIVIFSLFLCAIVVYIVFIAESSYDTPKRNAERKHLENLRESREIEKEVDTKSS